MKNSENYMAIAAKKINFKTNFYNKFFNENILFLILMLLFGTMYFEIIKETNQKKVENLSSQSLEYEGPTVPNFPGYAPGANGDLGPRLIE